MCNHEAQASEQLFYSHISHTQVLQNQALFIIDAPWYVETNYQGGGAACCSAAHDVDVQQSASQTGAILNQNCTRNRGDSRTSGNSKDTHKCARKGGLIPDHVRLALLLPTIRRIHSGTQTHGLLDHSPVTYSCGRCRRLHRETRAVARSWEQQQVQKGLTLMPKHVHHRSDYPHQSQDRHERTTMEK